MTAASVASGHWKKVMRMGLSFFRRGFNSSKCKTMTKMTRIKLLRNKREAVVKQMRRDIALLLQSGQDATARNRNRRGGSTRAWLSIGSMKAIDREEGREQGEVGLSIGALGAIDRKFDEESLDSRQKHGYRCPIDSEVFFADD